MDTRATNIDAISRWLVSQSLGDFEISTLFAACCRRLQDAGIVLFRCNISFRVLHPQIGGRSFTWWRSGIVEGVTHPRIITAFEDWSQSPYFQLLSERLRRLQIPVSAEAAARYPIIAELSERGLTDYVAYAVLFDAHGTDGMVMSFATDRPGGFTEDDATALDVIHEALALACKVHVLKQLGENIVSTYLGPDAGGRVLRGQIERGDCVRIHAAIWYSDLRNSTRLADTLTPEEYVTTLNAYFECTAGAVRDEGGEVLLLIGDAVLAIFPIEPTKPELMGWPTMFDVNGLPRTPARVHRETDKTHESISEADACRAVMRAAQAAEARMTRVNAERVTAGREPLDFGVGLHVGELLYGNIGVPERLQFTVVGPTANEVARLESLTKSLGERILVSQRFAENVPVPWRAMGAHTLRGFAAKMPVFAPPARLRQVG